MNRNTIHSQKLLFYLAIILILIGGVIVRINVAKKHRVPAGDEGAWLRLAVRVMTPEFMQSRVVEHDMYFERKLPHPEDNRSPLYPFMIAIFRAFNRDAYIAGQILNLAVFVLFFFSLAVFMKKTFGFIPAVAAAAFFSASPFIIIHSANIYPDLLVAFGLFILLVYAHSISSTVSKSLIGGIGFGLLFLLKSTAIFMIPALAAVYWNSRFKDGFYKKAAAFIMPVCLLSLPWIIRNYLAFGSPLYQTANYAMYMESWDNYFDIYRKLPNLPDYIAEYGLVHVVLLRPVIGFLKMIQFFPYFDHNLCLGVLPLSVSGIFYLKGKASLYKPFVYFSIFYIPVMAYLAYNAWVGRYIMPYYIVMYCLAGCGVGYICLKFKRVYLQVIIIFATIFIPLLTVKYPIEFYLSPRGSESPRDSIYREMIVAMKSSIPESSVVLSPFLSQYYFMHNYFVVNDINFGTVAGLEEFINIYSIDYILIEKGRGRLWALIDSPDKHFTVNPVLTRNDLILFEIGAKYLYKD